MLPDLRQRMAESQMPKLPTSMITTHTLPTAGASQCDIILCELKRHANQWVPMPHLASVSGSLNIHSRIADLAKRGHRIENNQVTKGRKRHSFYRILAKECQLVLL